MSRKNFLTAILITIVASVAVFGQTRSDVQPTRKVMASSAYEVLVLRRVALKAELIDLKSRFTNDSEVVKSKRFELRAVTLEMKRLKALGSAAASKFTSSYSDLILRKVALEVQLNDLRSKFTSDSPAIKKTSDELAILSNEITGFLK